MTVIMQQPDSMSRNSYETLSRREDSQSRLQRTVSLPASIVVQEPAVSKPSDVNISPTVSVPTAVGHPYHHNNGLMIMAYSIVSSFVFVTLFCWWSLSCTYIAILLGAAVS